MCKVLFCIAVHEQLIKKGNTPKIIAEKFNSTARAKLFKNQFIN